MSNDDFYSCTLSEDEKLHLDEKLSNVKKTGKCMIWQGSTKTKDGYGIVFYVFRGKRKKLTVHRLKYFLMAGTNLSRSMDVSHRCHTKLCININHLSYEPHRVNCSREKCRHDGECGGHRGYKRCIV